jgi:hypothetical protein
MSISVERQIPVEQEKPRHVYEAQHCIASVVQIPAGRRSVLDAYGEVILRGWRDAVGPCVAEVENNLIQVMLTLGCCASLFKQICTSKSHPVVCMTQQQPH